MKNNVYKEITSLFPYLSALSLNTCLPNNLDKPMRSMLLLLFMQTVPCFMFMAQPGDRVFSFFLKGVPEAL